MDEVRAVRGKAPGDQFSDWIDEGAKTLPARTGGHKMDAPEMRKIHRQLLSWLYLERERQAENRLQMAVDHDFYDNIQWDPEDAAAVKERGQVPLVYNEIAPMVDWLIGTERRTRADWKVLPRAEDDVLLADLKTKTLKYVSDINRVPFARSRAFADAVKGGVGWVDDGVRDDPTQDVLYSKYEDWRCVLWDSMSYELDLSDARYVFRWRWVDEDVALMMFPDRAAQIRQAVDDTTAYSVDPDEDGWPTENASSSGMVRAAGAASAVDIDTKRRRVKLIEAQFRTPCRVQVVASGPWKGAFFDPRDQASVDSIAASQAQIVDRTMMRVHFAVFTEAHMLACEPSAFRHNNFTLTPIWCYRRGRDRLPYGVVRRVRDIQQDLNKRASKALFLLNTNQIIADEGATDDWAKLRDEADRPDGLIVKKQGKELLIRRDSEAATGQIQMMTLDAQSIQKTAGINNENLGRQTNAVSGAAIEARQNQGAVGTTEPFDNLRFATQTQGQKQLSLVEQYYSEEKVIRLTGARGQIEWVRINQPEVQPDGSVRYINDITASQADFVVSEQDYSGTLRQVMLQNISQIAGTLPPEIALRVLTIAMNFSDLPNKTEIVDELRKVTGERDPNKEMTPEEMAQQEQQAAMQAEAMQFQREQAMLALEEAKAKVREINARAADLESKSQGIDGAGGASADMEQLIARVQQQAADEIDSMAEQLRKAQADLANRTMQIARDADTKIEVARIAADAQVRVAEIQGRANKTLDKLQTHIDALERNLGTRENNDTNPVGDVAQ